MINHAFEYNPYDLSCPYAGVLQCALQQAESGVHMTGFNMSEFQAEAMIRDFKLQLAPGRGDITGEKSTLFRVNGHTLRLQRTWTGAHLLYGYEWQPDSRWTGD